MWRFSMPMLRLRRERGRSMFLGRRTLVQSTSCCYHGVFREVGLTRAVSGGGAATVSPTFGAALWTMDYVLRAATSNIKRSYFHHGTIGLCYYCWWGRYDSTCSLSSFFHQTVSRAARRIYSNFSLLQNQGAGTL